MKFVTSLAMTMAAAIVLTLAGCNTVKGLGKDVEKVGEKTQEKAAEVSGDLKKDKKK